MTDIEKLKAELSEYKHTGAHAVRFASSSAIWSRELVRLFGDDAREGIDILEARINNLQELLRYALDVSSEGLPLGEEWQRKAREAVGRGGRS